MNVLPVSIARSNSVILNKREKQVQAETQMNLNEPSFQGVLQKNLTNSAAWSAAVTSAMALIGIGAANKIKNAHNDLVKATIRNPQMAIDEWISAKIAGDTERADYIEDIMNAAHKYLKEKQEKLHQKEDKITDKYDKRNFLGVFFTTIPTIMMEWNLEGKKNRLYSQMGHLDSVVKEIGFYNDGISSRLDAAIKSGDYDAALKELCYWKR